MRRRETNATPPANRAEEVRLRRKQASQQRAKTVTNRVVNPVRVRPVTMRGSDFGTPIHRRAGTKSARRQFYIAMDQAGAELRLPALPMVNPGWRLLSGLLVILSIVGIFSMWNSIYFRVTGVEVTGVQRLDPNEIAAALNLVNLSIIEVDPSAAQAKLIEAFPELVDVQLSVAMPNIVSVTASERQPVMAWQEGEKLKWIDTEGVIFPARGDVGPLVTIVSEDDLPFASSPILEEDETAEKAEEAESETMGLLPMLGLSKPKEAPVEPAAPLKVDPALITAAQNLHQKLPPDTILAYSHNNGLGWTDPQGWEVYIGRDLSEFEAKYAMYQSVSQYLQDQGIVPALVSVEHLNAPFYRLEQ